MPSLIYKKDNDTFMPSLISKNKTILPCPHEYQKKKKRMSSCPHEFKKKKNQNVIVPPLIIKKT